MSSFEERLIEEVRKYENLYVPSHKYYYDSRAKENAWKEIARSLNTADSGCRKRWFCLRDNFRKAVKARQTKSGAAAVKPVKYEDILSFLVPYLGDRTHLSTSANENPEPQYESQDLMGNEDVAEMYDPETRLFYCTTPTPPQSESSALEPKRQPHITTVLNDYFEKKDAQIRETKDPLKLFFEAMEETVRTLAPELQIEAKGKIAATVTEYELMNLRQRANQSQTVQFPSPDPRPSPLRVMSREQQLLQVTLPC